MLSKASIRYISVSILIYLLLAPSWLMGNIIFPYLGLSKNTGMVFVIANLFVIVLITHRKPFFSSIQKTFIFLYVVLAVYLLYLQLTIYIGSDNSTTGEIFMIIGGILVLFLLNNPRFDLKYFVRSFILLSFFFAFLSIIVYFDFLLKTRIIPLWPSEFPAVIITIGGYIAISDMYGNLYRNQSFWSEAARFAQFLIIPMALSFAKYIRYKKNKDFLLFVTMLIAYFLTFSVANIFATLFCGVLFFVLYKDVKTSISFKHKFIRRILNLIMGGIIFLLLFEFYNTTNKESYGDSVIGKNFNITAIDRVDRFNIAASVIKENFLGNRSLTRTSIIHNPTPYGLALIFGGVPYFLLVLANAIIFYFTLIKETRYLKYKYVYLGGLSFFIAFSWYGSFTEAYYLFQIALISTFIKNEKGGINFI